MRFAACQPRGSPNCGAARRGGAEQILCRRDQIRSRRLIDLGWDIMRFWVYGIRDDPDGALDRVKGWMAAAGRGSVG